MCGIQPERPSRTCTSACSTRSGCRSSGSATAPASSSCSPASDMRRSATAVGLTLLALSARAIGAGADPRLIEAVKQANPAALRSLLQAGVDVNIPEADGTSALAWAAHRDDVEMAAQLIREIGRASWRGKSVDL